MPASPGETVGSVSGVPISAGEFQRAYLQRRQMYERLYQGRIDAAMLRSLGPRRTGLRGLVRDKLVLAEAQRLGLRVGDEELAKSLTSSPSCKRTAASWRRRAAPSLEPCRPERDRVRSQAS
jgi:peptidyl-prolyl cis-trans isomerase D